jgi:hypothetical protein
MANDVMLIFTSKSLETCLKAGGSQRWVLDRARAKRYKYAVLCRNAHSTWGDGKEPHGTAFMIGRISDVVPSPKKGDKKARWLVKFDEYDTLDIPKLWTGQRNPVHYTSLEKLAISLDKINFKAMPEIVVESNKTEIIDNEKLDKLTIADAKKALAATFGVEPEAVEIIIHG